MNSKTIQDDQHFEQTPDGLIHWQRIAVEERWESLKADGSVWTWEATREDLIFRHLQSNAHFADHQQWLVENNHPKAGQREDLVPLGRIRKVTRYETASTWEVASDDEQLDEMTEQLNLPPCTHPADRIMDSHPGQSRGYKFCGRCCKKLEDKQ